MLWRSLNNEDRGGDFDIFHTVTGHSMHPEWMIVERKTRWDSSRVQTRCSGVANLVEYGFGRGP